MIYFPKNTELSVLIAKNNFKKLFKPKGYFSIFDKEAGKCYFTNEFSAKSIGVSVISQFKYIYVISINLKNKNFTKKVFDELVKKLEHKCIFILTYDDEYYIMTYEKYILHKEWSKDEINIMLKGLSLQEIWDNLLIDIFNLNLQNFGNEEKSLSEQIVENKEYEKLEAEINRVRQKMLKEIRPAKKREYNKKLQELTQRKGDTYGKKTDSNSSETC